MSIHSQDALISAPPPGLDVSAARKRTRDQVDAFEFDRSPFTIKDSSDPFTHPRTFNPVCFIGRSQLPLAYLDTAQPGSSLFSAYIHILESSHSHGSDAVVLITQDEKEKRLYAIERVKYRTYALCKLGALVKVDELRKRAGCVVEQADLPAKRRALQLAEDGEPWWSHATIDAPTERKDVKQEVEILPVLAMRLVMEKPQNISQPAPKTSPAPPLANETGPAVASPDLISPLPEPLPQDALQELAKHYLEALYLSRTSLAYFTKGPLSRARTAFSTQTSTMSFVDLINFLRQSILTSTMMDKKYRDSIPAFVKDTHGRSTQDLDRTPRNEKKKKRKKWKPKRDKAGFFVDEQDFVDRWWQEDEKYVSDSHLLGDLAADANRRRIARIRNRETFLQVILVLEVLALEASSAGASHSVAPAAETQDPETQLDETQVAQDTAKPKPKKKQDLGALLETLLDKLTIWYSLETHSPAKSRIDDKHEAATESNDELRNFCIEVIVPFYVSRIPQSAAMVNKKLGGPSAPSPVKRSRFTGTRKPGEPAVRQAPEKKPRQPLARVSTDTLNQASKRPIPSLHRSATDSETLATYIKREASESVPPMDSIPQAKPPRPVARPRPSLISQMSSFGKREVDLSAMSQASEAKLRKKAEVEEKLKEAISNLRKPDRERAGKEIVEERVAAKTACTKPKYGVQKTTAVKEGGAYVSATPSRHERRVKATPHHRAQAKPSASHTRSSEVTHVTSSSTRLKAEQEDRVPSSSFAVPATGHRPRQRQVDETPSRGFARFMPAGLAREPGTLDSPVAARTASFAVQQTPSRPMKRLTPGFSNFGKTSDDATPRKPPGRPLVATSPNYSRMQKYYDDKEERQSKSVYDALGWDDGYEELA